MLRKLNFTERVRIPRGAVQMTLRRGDDGVLLFDPKLSTEAFHAPAAARVFIEAYYRSSYMRFDCGTIGRFSPPTDRRLTDIDSDSLVRFRVKVVDSSGEAHQIVAVADDITAMVSAGGGAARVALLPVNFCDLQDAIWRVSFDDSGPVLDLNARVDGIEVRAKSDAAFFGLVYPAAVREILTRILLIENYQGSEETEEEWWSLWLMWGATLVASSAPDHEDDREVWIEDVVSAFCSRYQVAARFSPPEER